MCQYCVYILRSEKLNRFYIGSTSDYESRKVFHDNADSRKYTAKADDWVLYQKMREFGLSFFILNSRIIRGS